MNDLDKHLDNILRAAGSGLAHYSMQKSKDNMRDALQNAVRELSATPWIPIDEFLKAPKPGLYHIEFTDCIIEAAYYSDDYLKFRCLELNEPAYYRDECISRVAPITKPQAPEVW